MDVAAFSSNENCPVCKSDVYLNPTMKLFVSPCYHKICDLCIDRVFGNGSASCPTCGTILRKSAFSKQLFEDLVVEKEVRIRRIIANYLNKREEDFESLFEYNNYLEEVEEMAFNLLNDVQVSETLAKLEKIKQENSELNNRNNLKEKQEAARISASLECEMKEKISKREKSVAELKKEEQRRRKNREELINELATSDDPAISILAKKSALKASSMREQNRNAQSAFRTPAISTEIYFAHAQEATEDDFDPLEGITIVGHPFIVGDFLPHMNVSVIEWLSTSAVRAGGCSAAHYAEFYLLSAFQNIPISSLA